MEWISTNILWTIMETFIVIERIVYYEKIKSKTLAYRERSTNESA